MPATSDTEIERISGRYRRRAAAGLAARYEFTDPAVLLGAQELERALVRWIRTCAIRPVQDKRVLEIGCGVGNNLLELVRLGFNPAGLVGNELMPDRMATARFRLPSAVRLFQGDGLELQFADGSFDVVFQATVFSSILDDSFQERLAAHMWSLVGPGGGILWYDFVYDNPRNPDVKGVTLNRVRKLFPHGRMKYWRVTLAPPLGRLVARVHPLLYTLLNRIPALRTHLLCWVEKN
jgi:SAM-dependent methyltransferase